MNFADDQDYRRVAEQLHDLGYTASGIREKLDFRGLTAVPNRIPDMLRRTAQADPLDTSIRLWFLGVPVDEAAARAAVGPVPLERWLEAGLATASDGEVRPLVKLTPTNGLLLASDLPAQVRDGASVDFVMGPAKSSLLVATTMVTRAVSATLDFGTGCGLLALLAAKHSRRVVGTDKNPRAIEFAEFNARLNGIDDVEFRCGESLEPIGDETFEAIISNPPYVIAPAAEFMFCDSGWRGDEYCRRFVRDAAKRLEAGGTCQLTCNWGHRADQRWQDVVEPWFEDTGCDAQVWAGDTQDAARYAITWIEDTRARDDARFGAEFDRWMDYFATEGIQSVSYGVIAMRRRDGDNWVRCEETPSEFADCSGEDIFARFLLQDYLDSLDDRALLAERFRVAPHVRFEQTLAPVDDGFGIESAKLRRGVGLIQSMGIDQNIATLVADCSGAHSLQQSVETIANRVGAPAEQLVPLAAGTIRRLVQTGFVLPASMLE